MSACAASGLTGSEWGPVGSPNSYVQFKEDGVASGNGGCNSFSGSYEISGDTLKFGPLAATRRACVGEAMQHEIEFFQVMSETVRFSHDQEKKVLVLIGADGKELMRLIQRGLN